MASNVDVGFFNPRRRTQSMDVPIVFKDLRMVLVGKTGSGKSSCGNTILGTDAFKSAVSQHSVTKACSKQEGEVYNWKVTLVDTPGLFDTFLPEETIKREISKCINMSAPGPHAILIVVQTGTFTAEERDAVKKVEEIFGKDCWRYAMMLFTHGDEVDMEAGGIEQCLKEAGQDLKDILAKMGNRYLLFNNANANHREQVLQLLLKVEEMVNENKGKGYYTNLTYLETVQMLDEREAKLREVYAKKLNEEKQTIISKYETKLKESEQEQTKLKKLNTILEMEKKELDRYYYALENGVRLIVEQFPRQDSFEEILKFHETLKLN